MPKVRQISMKLDEKTYDQLINISAKRNCTISESIRKLLAVGMEKELARESVDYIREQINAEVKAVCTPQFDRMIKLTAKIGYQTVACFYLLCYIMDSILPAQKAVRFDEMKRRSKAMAVAYLKFGEDEFSQLAKSDDIANKLLEFDTKA